MTEKTYNMIEMGVVSVLSAGVDYVVDKTIKKAINPQKVPEKILTGVGILGVDLACNYGIYKMVDGVMKPNKEDTYKILVQTNIDAINGNIETARVMAEHEVAVENAVNEVLDKVNSMAQFHNPVDDILKKMGGTGNG